MTLQPPPKRILYMEDDLGLALLFKKKLERLGYEVATAPDGNVGLQMHDATPFDVLAVDLNMPECGGLSVIRSLAARNALPPTIMIIGSGDERTAVEAMKLGAMDYLVKDINGGYLELIPVVIEQILAHNQLLQDQRHSQQIIQQSEERYRCLVELSPDGIAVLVDGRFVFVNQATVALLGLGSRDELLECAILDFIDPEHQDAVRAMLRVEGDPGSPDLVGKAELVRLAGRETYCEIVSGQVMYSGVAAIQMIIRDVTERVQAEQLRHESERLRIALEKEQEVSELKTRLMTTLSHELRTPLAIIQSSTEFLDKYFYKLTDEKRQLRLHNIQKQIKKLSRFIEDISFLIQGAMSQLTPRFTYVNLERYCHEIVDEMQSLSETKRSIHLTLDGDFSSVICDPSLINLIITNLLSNAIKYSAEPAEIFFSVRQCGQNVIIQVKDSGIGIPKRDQERLFTIFHRGDNVGSVSGTGVGLAVVHEAVTAHSGSISFESEEGIGTTFTVVLPPVELPMP